MMLIAGHLFWFHSRQAVLAGSLYCYGAGNGMDPRLLRIDRSICKS